MTDAAKKMLTDLTKDYDDVVHALGRLTRHVEGHADQAVSEAAHTFVHSASELAEKLKKQSEMLAKKAGEEVREHPITTAAFAVAAVSLLGYAIAQKNKPK
jgi:ElaB/YqjD/DUF883 family membrane-anchored ribosome-binding protein